MSGGGKEENLEVICNVCDNFECHVFKKNVCRNCFHSKEEHAASNGDQEVLPRKQDINQPFDDTGKSKDMNLLGDKNKPKSGTGFSKSTPDILKKSTENLKDESDVKVDSKNKGKPPETHSKSKPPETAPKSKAPGKLVTGALSVKERLELKQKGSTGASSDSNKKPAQTKESEVKGNVSSLVTSQGSKKQTTADNKSSPVETSDSKPGEKSDANKKQGLTTTKVFTNSKLAGSSLLSQDKGLLSNLGKKQSTDKKDSGSLSQVKDSSSGDKNTSKISTKSEESSSKKSSVTTSKADDGSKVKHLTSKSEEFSSKTKQTTSKFEDKSKVTTSKTEEISNKFKQLSSKSFTGNNKEGLADTKFNSLGRKKVGVKEKLPSDTGTAADDCSAGTIKSPSSKEQGISHRAALGTGSAVSTSDKNTAQPIPGVNKSATGSLSSRFGGSKYGATPDNASGAVQNGAATKDKLEQLSTEKAKVNEELDLLRKKLSDMEGKCQSLDEENKHLREGMTEKDLEGSKVLMEKRDVENAIKGLKSQLTSMEVRCEKLETDNTSLLDKLKEQHIQQQQHQKENIENDDVTTEIADMEQQVDASEAIVTDLKDENDDLRQEIQDLKVEMDEMYDSFRDQEAEEFRDLQRELEITAKNCRILQFKLRKAERQNESVEGDRLQYEDKLRMLQNQFKDDDARAHIRSIEQELQMAKEVSVRLHDELDIMEDRRSKVEEENLHLTDILEKSDKKQFRLEMEIDKLKDKIVDLQNQLANRTDRESPASEEVTDRRVILGRMGKQSSQELDSSQLMKDLYDSMERETDLKDQLQLMEEEAKTSRRKLEELEEENENLSIQLKKMSAAQVIKGKEGFRETTGFPASEEEAELKIHLDLNNQELSVLKKKFHDLEEDNENLLMECGKLSEELRQKEILLNVLPEPSSPNYYYEDKIKDMKIEADELRWKIIEKEREIERLNAQCVLQTRQSRLKMSRSLEGEHHLGNVELKKQVENIQLENSILKDKVIRLTGGRKDEAEDLLSSPVSDQKQLATTYPGDGESVKDDKLRALQLRIDQLEKHRPLSPPSDNIGNIGYKSAKSKVSRDASRVTSRDAPRDLLQQQRPSVLDLREASVYNDNSVRSRSPGGASRVSTGSSLPRIDTPVPSPACLPSIAKPSFPGLRSVDVLSPGETREELMDQILDMEEEVEKLTGSVKLKDQELTKLYGEVRGLKDTIQNLKDEFRKKEIELLRDLDVSHDKADILSNLLDIVKERADDAEAELERLIESQSCSATSSENSARTVSTLSNVSSGSDEVFDGSGSVPGSPDTGGRHLIHKNWEKRYENQFRKRINCLERLLAEERKRVATTEKKLALVSTETLSSAMSDDAKLHEREKELLQSEVLDSTKLLKIASDQIKGLRERVLTLEDENKVLQSSQTMAETEDSDIDQTPSGSVDTVIERPIGGVGTEGAKAKTPSQSEDEIIILGNEVEVYHSKVLELEAHLEEVNEYWQSQIVNRDKERESFMKEAKKMSEDCDALKDTISKLKDEDIRKEKLLKDLETMVQDKEDIAYQIQHHEKLLRAEYLAMKVRYETRLENLQKEHMNLLSLLDTMQREKTLDKEIIRGVQKGMSQMKVTYAKDLVKWDAEKDILARHIKEIDEGRKLAKDMQGKIEELKNQLADQEYERAELVNRITTERSGWGVDKSNMQSKINQLQEQLAMVSQAQNRTKNMQNRMEVAWEQERSEQKRLLAEAHSLALDLQSQLKARDEEYVRERKMLIEQLRRMRTEIDEEQLSRDSRQKEIDERGLRISELDRILKEVGERASKEQEMSVKERADLVRRLGEMRKQHKRDQRRVEDVLTGLTRLKELAAIVSDSEKEGNTSDTELVSRLEKLSTGPLPELDVDLADPMHLSPRKSIRQRIDQVVLKHIKESLKEIHFAVEDIGRPREISEEERKKLRRSLSSSEIDFLKEDFSAGRQRDSGKFDSPKASPLTIQTDTASPRYLRSVTHNGSGDLLNQPACDLLLEINPITSLPLRQKFIMADVHYEQSVSTKFPDPPPSFLISPKSHSRQTLTDTTFSLYSQKTLSSKSQDANQPLNVNKTRLAPTSISLDTTRVNSLHTGSQSKLNTKSVSAGGTPTYESASLLSSIPVLNRGTSSDTSLSPRSGNSSNSGSYERLTPRSARRKFFEDQSDLQPSSSMSEKSQSCEGIQEDKISTKPPTVDTKRLRLQHDESEDDMIGQLIEDTKPRILTQSVSVDEKTSHSVAKSSSTESKKSKPEKPKRKIIKRSQSVDSSVKKSVAKAGITAMSPGAPSNTKAVELFATVRRKIKNTLKRSSSMTDEEKSTAKQGSSSEASGSTSGEEFNKAGGQKSSGMVYRPSTSVHKPMVGVQKSTTSPEHESQSKPPPTPPISSMNRRALPEMEDDALTNGRKRIPDISPDNKPNKRLRSKSAERATRGPSALKQQVILEEDLLPDRSKVFSETTV
ncbi:golgin subfamily A member 4-like isoform X3 [Mizuhopecten yessoensis]|uniref:golgin subfamily A member 4-like isoform X3 n=1 Tax=Mizuhopecten yessoensis TaxID=6573 RepID=UPI000B4578B9|nr:golgin subfamily A member 4-like isoform X3 [Mizuhopecten yessoensis]